MNKNGVIVALSTAVIVLIAGVGVLGTIVLMRGGSESLSHARMSATAGGAVSLSNGARLFVPPDALPQDADVSMSEVAADDAHGGTAPEGLAAVGRRIEVQLGNERLRMPARLELPFDRARIPAGGQESAVFAAYFDEASRTWVPAGGEVDAATGIVATETAHASWWSVFYPLAPGSPLTRDRRYVYLPAVYENGALKSDAVQLCPYVADVALFPNVNPCSISNDEALDPINVAFYDLEPPDIVAELLRHGWHTVEGTPDQHCEDRLDHSAYAGPSGSPVLFGASAQAFSGECAGQFHVRLFKVPGTRWTLGAVHVEEADPLLPFNAAKHKITGSWEGAEMTLRSALTEEYAAQADGLFVQRACPGLCTFRGYSTNGWATLVTARGAGVTAPDLTIAPNRGPVGTGGRVEGHGFPAYRQIKVYGDLGRANVFVNTVMTDGAGNFHFDDSVKSTYYSDITGQTYATVPGPYVVRAQATDDDLVFAETLFIVDPPSPAMPCTPTSSPPCIWSPPPAGAVSSPGRVVPPIVPISPPGGVSSPGRVVPPSPPGPFVSPPQPVSPPGQVAPPPPAMPPSPPSPPTAIPVPTPAPLSPPGRVTP